MAQSSFRAANVPRRLIPAAIVLGTSTFTMSALPGTPAIQNAIPMPFFGTTPFAAPGLGIIASLIILAFGLLVALARGSAARAAGEGYGPDPDGVSERVADNEFVRERATAAREFDPREIERGYRSQATPPILGAALPLGVVVSINLLMSLAVLPRLDLSYLAKEEWGATSCRRWVVCGQSPWLWRPPLSPSLP